MEYFKKAIILISLISLFGCTLPIMLESRTKAMYREQGTVLKEYQKGEDYIMIIKEGDVIVKYRLYNYGDRGYGTFGEAMYVIDTTNQSCLSGTGETIRTPIDCDKVKRDPDLAQYITW